MPDAPPFMPAGVTLTDALPEAHKLGAPVETKRPLFRSIPPPKPFPMRALGPLRAVAEAIQTCTQAPAAICAQSVLAAATLATQPHRDVILPGAGKKPLVSMFATIAESGERKTTVDRIALAPVYQMEERWREQREAQMPAFRDDHEAWKAARDRAKKLKERSAIRQALERCGPEPKPPPQAMLVLDDFTPEALVLHLKSGRPYAGVFTAEGGTLVGGHAFKEEKLMQTGALFNSLWDGSPIRRTRVQTGTDFMPGRRVSSHVMMQRVVAERLLGDPLLAGMGLLARTLTVAPESTAGTRLFQAAQPECQRTLDTYDARLTALLERPPATRPDCPDVLDPPALTLSGQAAVLWQRFYNVVEQDLAPNGALRPIMAFASKLAEHAGRLAAVLTVYADPDAMEVTPDAMACGIELAKHYAGELLRLSGAAAVSPDLQLADRLLAWWQSRSDPQCHLAAIYQRGLNAIGDAATARRIVAVLEDHGHVRRLPSGTLIDGAARRDAWELEA